MTAAVLAICLGSCAREKPVARVAGREITPAEFRERFEDYLFTTGDKDNILVREKIVNNMINEIAITADDHAQGFDADSAYQAQMRQVTSQALLDAYGKRITVDTIRVSEPELWNEFRASRSKISARFLYAKTEAAARALKDRLEHGGTFTALAKEVFTDPRLASSGGSLGYFDPGDVEQAFEDAAWRLPLGALSDPVRLREGWAIIRVDDRMEVPLASELDYAAAKPKLEKAIRERKILGLLAGATDSIAHDLDPQFNERAVDLVLTHWSAITGEDAAGISHEEARAVPADLRDTVLVRFRNATWTIGEFVRRSDDLSTRFRRRVHAAEDVREVVVGLATREVLLASAAGAGLERSEGVRRQITGHRDLYLLRRWEQSVVDTVTASMVPADSVDAYYAQNRDLFSYPPELDVAEILVRYPREADSLAHLIRLGADFAALARSNTVRPWGVAHGGDLGYAPRSRYGILADTLFRARTGAVIGPLAVGPFRAIFRILGRKEGRLRTLEEAREDIINVILPRLKKRTYEEALMRLRNRSVVSIDLEALGNVVIPRN